MKHLDILIPGNYSCDRNLYSKHFDIVPGGVTNTIVALRRLGVNMD